MREIKIKSNIPIYLVGVSWVMYALMLPLYRWYDFVIAAVVSALVYWVSGRMIPDTVVMVEEKPEPVKTGNSEVDEVVEAGRVFINQMYGLNLSIYNQKISEQIDELVQTAKGIFDYVRAHPEKIKDIRQFMDYYMPTTLKLLRNYDELSRQQVKGENINSTLRKIEEAMDKVVLAFRHQMDDLYKDKALDVTVDIKVLETMIKQEGLTQDGLHIEKEPQDGEAGGRQAE